MNLGLKSKRVVVTGSSKGIGHAIVKAFFSEGAAVWVTGRNRRDLKAAVLKFSQKRSSLRVESTSCDLTSESQRKLLVRKVEAKWNAVDVLVLNLGSGRSRPGMEVEGQEWDRVLNLNLVSAMDTLRLMLPLLRKGESPNVVFVGSIAGREAIGAPLAYGAAKAALSHSMKASSRLLGKEGIRVNMVAPGNIYFKGGVWDRKMQENPEQVSKMLENHVPLGRLGSPDEVADAVLYLASRKSAFVTGSSLVVDGGQTVFPG